MGCLTGRVVPHKDNPVYFTTGWLPTLAPLESSWHKEHRYTRQTCRTATREMGNEHSHPLLYHRR